jgi:cytochrome P450
MIPPKPPVRPDRVSFWRYVRLFRSDILSAQPARLYRAWMAEFRTPFFRSYLCSDPSLVARVLNERPADFPKSERLTEGLRPLLGDSVFVTNGAVWEHQRRIIDPAFEGGRLREVLPGIVAAGLAAAARMQPGLVEVEEATSHAAADVIFRTLFSIPVQDAVATAVFREFRNHQRGQPILNLGAIVALPHWFPRLHRRQTRATAARIRSLITRMTEERAQAITAGSAPDDLVTRIMTTPDPATGACFSTPEMVDQVAIFFLAGHETSASALAWALYLLALFPAAQDLVAAEAMRLPAVPTLADLSRLRFTRDVFRETLRLYPPVPMMVRENAWDEAMRGREVAAGSQIVISPWHLHRHERLWDRPDEFDPDRWQTEAGRASARDAYLPFSSGPRVCVGAGFAMAEGVLLLALLVRNFSFARIEGRDPVPVAHLTVRARDGIWLDVARREHDKNP